MEVSIKGKKIVVWDSLGGFDKSYDPSQADVRWFHYSGVYLYQECLKRGIQIITPDMYFALPNKPERAICVRERNDADMSTSLALRKAGVRLALLTNSEQPLYACRFFWDIRHITGYFDNCELQSGVKSWVAPNCHFFRPLLTPHAYYHRINEVQSNFKTKKFLNLMNSNVRIHWLRRLYVDVMNFIKPLPTFINREQYKDRLEAIQYFSKYHDFDLYGYGWDKPVRYTHKYDEAIRKSYRGSPHDKFEAIKQYKFSIIFDAFLGGLLQEKMADCLYAGSVPVYWGAPDVADIIPEGCFIDFRKFGCDYKRLDEYLRNMDEKTYSGYIKNINAWISSPTGGYALSQEKYARDTINLIESYF